MKIIDPNTPGGRLRIARKNARRSLDDLAAHTGFSRVHLNHMELNTYKGGRQAWEAVAIALGLTLDHLLSGADLPSAQNGKELAHAKDEQLLLLIEIWPLLELHERRAVISVAEAFVTPRRDA